MKEGCFEWVIRGGRGQICSIKEMQSKYFKVLALLSNTRKGNINESWRAERKYARWVAYVNFFFEK